MQKIFLIVGTFYGFVLQGMNHPTFRAQVEELTMRAQVNKLIIKDFEKNNKKKQVFPEELEHLNGITYDYEFFWATHYIKNNGLQIAIALKNEAIKKKSRVIKEKEVNQSIAIDKSDECFIDKLLKQEDNYIQNYVETLKRVFTKNVEKNGLYSIKFQNGSHMLLSEEDLDEHYNDYEDHQKAGMVSFNQQVSNILKKKEEKRQNKEKK